MSYVSPEIPDKIILGRMSQSDEILLNELWNEFEEISSKVLEKATPYDLMLLLLWFV